MPEPQQSPNPFQTAMMLINDPAWCRIIASYLLMMSTHEEIATAIAHLRQVDELLGHTEHEFVTRLAELEAERARWFDPNHPGE